MEDRISSPVEDGHGVHLGRGREKHHKKPYKDFKERTRFRPSCFFSPSQPTDCGVEWVFAGPESSRNEQTQKGGGSSEASA